MTEFFPEEHFQLSFMSYDSSSQETVFGFFNNLTGGFYRFLKIKNFPLMYNDWYWGRFYEECIEIEMGPQGEKCCLKYEVYE